MSDLQRSFAKAKLAGLPFEPPLPSNQLLEEEHEEQEYGIEEEESDDLEPLPESAQDDDSSSASSASSTSSTGTIRPSPSKHLFARPNKGSSMNRMTFDPLPWNDYFDEEFYLKDIRPHETIIYHIYLIRPIGKGPLVVAHHGAGSSGLSFALFAIEIRKALPTCGILSLDARGHGETVVEMPDGTKNKEPSDLSLKTLSQDLLDVILLAQKELSWSELPGIVLVGHSLGGPVVTDLAMSGKLGDSILGYAVLDVVEGSALDALKTIEWHVRSRTLRNTTSARISVPSLLRPSPLTDSKTTWIWRTGLSSTQDFWENWFAGLSQKFLAAKGGKLLILAGTDRLDKELMIGQMQGKYQLQVFPEAGHFLHEDQPSKTAMIVADFYRRNDQSALVLPPKVGDMMKKAPVTQIQETDAGK